VQPPKQAMHLPGPNCQLRLCEVMAKAQPGRTALSEACMSARQHLHLRQQGWVSPPLAEPPFLCLPTRGAYI